LRRIDAAFVAGFIDPAFEARGQRVGDDDVTAWPPQRRIGIPPRTIPFPHPTVGGTWRRAHGACATAEMTRASTRALREADLAGFALRHPATLGRPARASPRARCSPSRAPFVDEPFKLDALARRYSVRPRPSVHCRSCRHTTRSDALAAEQYSFGGRGCTPIANARDAAWR
jgi:ABC-type uncharacterized transport system YnjBCD ATPase subunit